MAMFKEAADIKTSDQLHLPVPEAKFETVVVKPSEIQKDMVQALSERAAEVHSGSVDPSVDNMLKITSDGRKIGLDQRLMNSALPDDPNSKLNACVNNVLRIWNDTKEQKLTQLIFCDMSTPKGDGSFNVYDDIRTKLLNAGVPEQEIEFIHNADTENKKAELFSKVRSGQVRVLLGSTAKMGAGTNVQTLLVAVHHLDVGWRPSDMTQRNGRIIRQGNQNKQVYVYNYVTESTFDAYLYQTLENKQKFISQIMARYLSRAELSYIAGKYIEMYYALFGISKNDPAPINPEQFANSVLGLNLKMLPLCSDGHILGLTVFQRCSFTATLEDGTKLVEVFMPRDIVIDSALAADRCTGCRNFTIAHEAAHQILADLFPNDYGKAVKCRGHIAYRERNGNASWEEWQADTLAAELLMPTFLINAEIERVSLTLPNGILYKSVSDPNYEKILEMARRIGVSWSAIRIRLQQMQVIKGKPIHCHPLDIMRFGE